mgnify:CR=1 FL=1
MNYGYVKVAAAVPRVHVADCKFNAGQIEKEIIIADGKGVQIIAFPELCITGYTCGDLFAQQLLLEEAELGLMQVLNTTRQLDIISIVGMPVVCEGQLRLSSRRGGYWVSCPRPICLITRNFMRCAGLYRLPMYRHGRYGCADR